jgi:hypothetical protein
MSESEQARRGRSTVRKAEDAALRSLTDVAMVPALIGIHLYVDDVDPSFKKALAAGAIERKPVMDQFYGDRSGRPEDPFGLLWWVATRKEDIAPEELQKRVQALCSSEAVALVGLPCPWRPRAGY